MKLKQIFCRHIYKEKSREALYQTREPFGSRYGFTTYENFVYFASHRECVKCGKQNVVKLRVIRI